MGDLGFIREIPSKNFKIGYAGTLGLSNNLESFIKAAHLLRNYEDITFVLVGRGKEEAYLKNLVKDFGLINVVFAGAVPKKQIQSVLQQFNTLFIGLTSDPVFKYGISPNKLFDYLYSGRPILYAIDSGDYHPITDARAGIELPPEDPQALADAILEMYKMDNDERHEWGKMGAIMRWNIMNMESLLTNWYPCFLMITSGIN